MDVAGWLLAHSTIRCDSLIASASQLRTLTGAPNRIVGFDRGRVFVATDRSGPEGRAVPISWIQDALDKLEAAGEVEISVESVGYRSAFIGAVLSQVPGARTSTAPLRVMLDGGTDSEAVTSERRRRDEMWQDLGAQGGPEDDSQWFVAWEQFSRGSDPEGSHMSD